MEGSRVIDDAKGLARIFNNLPQSEGQPAIIVVSGLPGTGKTHFCRRLAERLPCTILESDAIRKKIYPRPTYSPKESAGLFRAIHVMAATLLGKGVNVILDATNLEERHRKTVYKVAERAGARLILVQVEAPPEVVQKRLKSRVDGKAAGDFSDADWSIYQRMKPQAEKIKQPHFTVDTSRDITPVIDKIIEAANR